ncbi:glutamine amidotransferase [Fistulina hepatica ATCC 64428]|uniref:Multifunctional tryptophan biosynthesis protein n=1 Tax=Fistulina hepatica ATCC 64428 TaxID=1128425 RepID=A0A0D7AJ05_9AGAR|nr:glutamine amidotransferase [Fistulina hepatica ATCC 64428]
MTDSTSTTAATSLPVHLQGELDVLMIDNFDSFTWNLYQQLCLLGAQVTVIRNDAITVDLFPQLKIKSLIISPGPGHPKTDSGISNAAITYFSGKVPVLGVCMGLECLVDALGGEIGYAGEIMHGKVSAIRHDARGCFKDIPQGIKSTRYHSLSAAHTSLPADLAITAIAEESGVIMGVRHRKYTVEAVQYHPESILSEGGDALIQNFLSLRGGLWEENPASRVLDPSLPKFPTEVLPPVIANNPASAAKIPSILQRIYRQRIEDVANAQSTPGTTTADLRTLLALNIAPPLISFVDRLKQGAPGHMSLLAEIKRASPSKGHISVTTSPAAQALTYALSGAHTISVLTEPKWFLGSLQDMLHARMSVGHLPNRPAILRKDFILSRYQIMEARIWGADTVLLIVSMLPETTLRDLYSYSRELGMEPLVEVNNAMEMEIALSLPAKVIGVNNRNLHDFNVDMGTTSRLSEMVKGRDVILAALSGISSPDDVKKYQAEGVSAVLIGESLMRAKDTSAFIRQLFSQPEPEIRTWSSYPPLVKICGIRGVDEAVAVAKAGADFLGLMFVESSKRAIDLETAKQISSAVRALRFQEPTEVGTSDAMTAPWFALHATRLSSRPHRPLLVGVFQNASLDTILHCVSSAQLDMVQLHGLEPVEWVYHIPVPVIKVFHVGDGTDLRGIARGGAYEFVLLDSLRVDGLSGGSGQKIDLDLAKSVVDAGEIVLEETPYKQKTAIPVVKDLSLDGGKHGLALLSSKYPMPIILAGGLDPTNVVAAIEHVRPWAVDVSGGVETEDGLGKDLDKVRAFIDAVKESGPTAMSAEYVDAQSS